MADYIDRKELLEDLERFAPEGRAALLIVRKQKTVDAVPVVRCKDCKHYVWDEFDGAYVCLSIGRFVKPDFWCAHGERRTDD